MFYTQNLVKYILFILLFFQLGGCLQEEVVPKVRAQLAGVEGRGFTGLSVCPDSQTLLIIEQHLDTGQQSKTTLFRYNLDSKAIHQYDLSDQYNYSFPYCSSSGKYIILGRTPRVEELTNDNIREAFNKTELIMMDYDGTNIQKLPIQAGLKLGGAISPDDRYIAYWRAEQRPLESKSFANQFNIRELDLATGEDKSFAGEYDFFQGGSLQYYKDNKKLLISAGFPMAKNLPGRTQNNFSDWTSEYRKKFYESDVYTLTRNILKLPDPLTVKKIEYISEPSMDAEENIYFQGASPGFNLYRSKPNELSEWFTPWKDFTEINSLTALADGSAMVFIFRYPKTKRTNQYAFGIGMLDIKKQQWLQLDIPKLGVNTPTN